MMCDHTWLPLNTEAVCVMCGHWYYHDSTQGPVRLYDRDLTEAQMTAKEQAVIASATRFLTEQGQRYGVDFGWQNAESMAASLGWPGEATLATLIEVINDDD
jgi:hypothetical protein